MRKELMLAALTFGMLSWSVCGWPCDQAQLNAVQQAALMQDGGGQSDPGDPAGLPKWDLYQNLGEKVNAWDHNCEGVISPDGKKLFYNYHHVGLGGQSGIYVSVRTDSGWSAPEYTGIPGGQPSLTKDGKKLFFGMPGGLGESTWDGAKWSEPKMLVFDETAPVPGKHTPAIYPDGKKIIFCSTPPEQDLYYSELQESKGTWSQPKKLNSFINSAGTEWHPFVTYDGKKLYFTRDAVKTGNYGSPDIWMSKWDEAAKDWAPPVNIGMPANYHNTCSVSLTEKEDELFFGGFKDGGYGGLDEYSAKRLGEGEKFSSVKVEVPTGQKDPWKYLGNVPGASVVLRMVEAPDGTFYAGTFPGGLYKSSDKGTAWTRTTDIPGAIRITGLVVLPDGTIVAGIAPGAKVFRSTDGGKSWSASNVSADKLTVGVTCMIRAADGTLYAGTSGSAKILKSTDDGRNWSVCGEVSAPGAELVYCMAEGKDGALYTGIWSAGSPEVGVTKSTDHGATWTPFDPTNERGSIYMLFSASDGTMYSGAWTHIQKDVDGVFKCPPGGSWKITSQIPGQYADMKVWSMAEAGDGTLYVGIATNKSGELVFKSPNKGETWTSTGVLASAREVLCLLLAKDGSLYAGTAPNGSVYKLPVK